METIFMNTENSKTSEPNRFKLDLTDKINLKNPNKNMALVLFKYLLHLEKHQVRIQQQQISAPAWNKTFNLPDGSHSIKDIQDYFEFTIKKHETLTEDPPVKIYPNKIKKRIAFKIKTRYKLELLTPEAMRLLGSTKKILIKIKTSKMYQN